MHEDLKKRPKGETKSTGVNEHKEVKTYNANENIYNTTSLPPFSRRSAKMPRSKAKAKERKSKNPFVRFCNTVEDLLEFLGR